MITKENLVVLKGQSNFIIRETQTTFEANKHYRCIEVEDELLVYGVKFNRELFNEMFEYLHDRLMREFKQLGLIKDGQAISKSAFGNLMDIRKYGKGKGSLFMGFFGSKMNGIIAFDCYFAGQNKTQFIGDAYGDFIDIINGDLTSVDSKYVQRGNSGVPIAYGEIYFRKQYNPDNKDLAIYY